jgi:hypothetical protein
MRLYPGKRFRLNGNLTAINKSADAHVWVERLPADTVLTIAEITRGSAFVRVLAGTAVYEVAVEDLEEAAEPIEDR